MGKTAKSVIYSVVVVFSLIFLIWTLFSREIINTVMVETGKATTDKQNLVNIIKEILNDLLQKYPFAKGIKI